MADLVATWANDYVGIPFIDKGRDVTGLDCWGVIYLVFKEELTIDIPSYTEFYTTISELRELAALIKNKIDPAVWIKVETAPCIGDAILFRVKDYHAHVGVVVGGGYMLHALENIGTCCDKFYGSRWRDRIIGMYRHKDMFPK